jgi:hypothetical protein
LRSNQGNESLHSWIHFNLDRKMTLLELFQHFDNCLVKLRTREPTLDFVSNYKPCVEPDASFLCMKLQKGSQQVFFYDEVSCSLKETEKCY